MSESVDTSNQPSSAGEIDDARRWLLSAGLAIIRHARAAATWPEVWSIVAAEAEAQHLAPLVDAGIQAGLADAPDEVVRTLRAQSLRQLARHRTRTTAIADVLREFDRRSIDVLLLKGAALGWMVYPSPALRPMGDVDVLVRKSSARAAQQTLVDLGFAPSATYRPFGRNAHHLPVVSQHVSGMTLHAEVHTDALSRDAGDSITWETLAEPPQRVMFDETPRATLGHIDTLRHLTRHLIEPSADGRVRLIGIADLVAYLTAFGGAIDWEQLHRKFPVVINALSCVHQVAPLPESVRRFVPLGGGPPCYPAGRVLRPLRAVFDRGRPVSQIADELFRPPEWWMHAYYNVSPDNGLGSTRVFRHPWTVLGWLYLRLRGI